MQLNTSGSTAKLVIPVLTKKWNPKESHWVAIAPKNDDGCSELSRKIRPETFEKDMTITIAGDRDILFSIQRVWHPEFCANMFGQFHAKKDYEYILNLDIIGRYCVVSILEKSPNETFLSINPTKAYKSSIGGNKFCDSKDKIIGPAM